jgi:WS/DGAT/MGAT family acyltransferase
MPTEALTPAEDRTPPAADRVLPPADAFFVYAESWRVPQTVVAACLSDADMTRDGLVAHLASRLGVAPWLRRALVRRAGGWRRPVWRMLPAVDFGEHVREAAVPPPGGTAGLDNFVAAVGGWRFPDGRPQWRMWVLPDLGPGQSGYVIAVHHALCDGPALVELLGPLFDPQVRPPAPPAPQVRPQAPPDPSAPAGRSAGGLAAAVRHRRAAAARAGHGVALLAADGPVRTGPFTRRLLPPRRFASAAVPLPTVRAAARAGGAQPTDVVLAALAGAVGGGAIRTPGRARPLRVAVPVLARAGSAAADTGNRTAGLWVHLPLDEPDPVRRLRLVAADRARRGTSARALGARFVMERVGGMLPAPLHALAVRAAYCGRFFHAIVSVMPGPRRTPWLGPGEIRTAHPLLPLADRVGLGLGGLVWGDALCLGLVGEARAVPDPGALLGAVVAEIEAMAAAAEAARGGRDQARGRML